MSSDRFVLLGLARPRTTWFGEVSRWATSAIVPAEFLKCVSVEELRARLASGRTWSAALLDGSLPMVDRDLLAAVRDAGCAPIVVDDRDAARWRSLGAAAVLPSTFDRGALLEVLDVVARTVGRASTLPDDRVADDRVEGLLVAVCGPGGTGASSVAACIAQGLGATARTVVLADLARHAEQALLHDVRDVVPGVQELVEAHRSGVPTDDDVRSLTFDIVDRGYSLLLGLRRARYWSALRPRAFETSVRSLRRSFDAVVADVTADLEGADDGGSNDVEERNVAARTAVTEADVVVVVGRSGIKGVHALVRVVADLVAVGMPAGRILPMIAAAPRSPKVRAEIAAAVAELSRPVTRGGDLAAPVFLPSRAVEQAFRDGAPMPSPLPQRATGAVLAVLARVGPREVHASEPVAVAPGSVGSYTDGDW